MDPRNLGERLEATDAIDRVAEPVHQRLTAVLPSGPVKDVLHGVWLGHPLHPVLTDLPIGFWTSAVVLDLVGGRDARPAADALVGIGVAAALPTAATGLADWSDLDEGRTSLRHRPRRRQRGGNRALRPVLPRPPPRPPRGWGGARPGGRGRGQRRWLPRRPPRLPPGRGCQPGSGRARRRTGPRSRPTARFSHDHPTLAHLDGEPLAAAQGDHGAVALFDRCSHLGGPLHEGGPGRWVRALPLARQHLPHGRRNRGARASHRHSTRIRVAGRRRPHPGEATARS